MGQIVKRKKKGRPSKADLARRLAEEAAATPGSDVRRSHRRRNVRYSIDIDDYIDEDDEDDVEEVRRREKKLKLVVKLNGSQENHSELVPNRGRARSRRVHAPSEEEEEEEDEEEDCVNEKRSNKLLNKRQVRGDDDDDEDEEDKHDVDEVMERERNVYPRRQNPVPGTQAGHPSGIPLPDKKLLELILDKLQKKDIYGVYAEPVDPEELPDYHDVIEHPMDFATVRKKLANGSYSTLEQLESDVFLICSNAMQYNSAETIYYKQARSIQELAKRKFDRLRFDIERSEKDLMSEQKERAKKQMKNPLCQTSQEPLGSDFSSGATLATATDVQNWSHPTQVGVFERRSTTDLERNPLLNDSNLERADELLSGKDLLPKLGRKPIVLDDNRRSTYSVTNQPILRSESVFTTFEGEIKQLVAVGLHAEYSYGRSLARFAATLGPVAWKVASQRIEQALPAGSKFGRGWVGEYEPLPTPVLMLENRTQKESAFASKLQCATGLRKDDKSFRTPVPVNERLVPNSEWKPSLFGPAGGPILEAKRSSFGSAGTKPSTPVSSFYQQQNPLSRNIAEPEKRVLKQVELNSPSSANQNNASHVAEEKLSANLEKIASQSRETASKNTNLLNTVPFKQPDSNSIGSGGLPNRNVTRSSFNDRIVSPSPESVPNQMTRGATLFSRGQEQGLSDPVQLMRMLAEKAQIQQHSSTHSTGETLPVTPSVPSVRREDSSNAAAAAARAWMSIGAGGFKQVSETSSPHNNQISADSLYNPSREFHQVSRVHPEFTHPGGLQFQAEKASFPHPGFVPQHVRMGNDAQFQNRPMVFPQMVATDLSRFQVQSPWRGLSPHSQPRLRQEMLPPDLNIGFQSPASPVKQTSSVLVESQQPDLALQL